MKLRRPNETCDESKFILSYSKSKKVKKKLRPILPPIGIDRKPEAEDDKFVRRKANPKVILSRRRKKEKFHHRENKARLNLDRSLVVTPRSKRTSTRGNYDLPLSDTHDRLLYQNSDKKYSSSRSCLKSRKCYHGIDPTTFINHITEEASESYCAPRLKCSEKSHWHACKDKDLKNKERAVISMQKMVRGKIERSYVRKKQRRCMFRLAAESGVLLACEGTIQGESGWYQRNENSLPVCYKVHNDMWTRIC
mmetsp:Transcript_11605/g.13213  ORF Transcript_11605/g.13213 Transcript_11605/m.13213 type:complete len:251 (-) Transcript_11605:132-884(-)